MRQKSEPTKKHTQMLQVQINYEELTLQMTLFEDEKDKKDEKSRRWSIGECLEFWYRKNEGDFGTRQVECGVSSTAMRGTICDTVLHSTGPTGFPERPGGFSRNLLLELFADSSIFYSAQETFLKTRFVSANIGIWNFAGLCGCLREPKVSSRCDFLPRETDESPWIPKMVRKIS